MSGFYDWKCNSCDNVIEVKPNCGFYRDAEGTLKLWGHTMPLSEEAEEFGLKGFYVQYYCPKCRKLQNAIDVEFETPNDFNDRQFERRELMPPCPVCGTVLVMEPSDTIVCPKCEKGRFAYLREIGE